MFQKILIVCIGNICRSPMGEALFTERLSNILPGVSVKSAGIEALVDKPATEGAHILMSERGLDISQHRARQLTPQMLLESDLILTMDSRQQAQIEYMLPNIRGRAYKLGKWSGFDVPDPYKRPHLIYKQALALIEQGVIEWQEKVWK